MHKYKAVWIEGCRVHGWEYRRNWLWIRVLVTINIYAWIFFLKLPRKSDSTKPLVLVVSYMKFKSRKPTLFGVGVRNSSYRFKSVLMLATQTQEISKQYTMVKNVQFFILLFLQICYASTLSELQHSSKLNFTGDVLLPSWRHNDSSTPAFRRNSNPPPNID